MPELSNLLRQRLAATEDGGARVHPDADTLTAYVEQSLPAAERKTVVTHLSVCEPCRAVVALSQPDLPELVTQTVLKPAPVPVWRRLFTAGFGLAASVAAMAVIAVLVLQLPQRSVQPSTQSTEQAKVTPQKDQSPQAEEKRPVPAAPAEMGSASAALADQVEPAKEAPGRQRRDESDGIKVAAGFAAPRPAKPAANVPVLAASLRKEDYVNTNFFTANSSDNIVVDGQSNNDFPSAPQPQPSSTNGAFAYSNGKTPIFADIPPSTDGKSNVRILTPAPPPQPFDCKICKMPSAIAHGLHLHAPAIAPAIRAGTVSSSAMGGLGSFSATLAKNHPAEVSAAPEKAESAGLAGFDALSPGSLSASGFRSREAAPTVWKVAGGKLFKSAGPSQWEDAYPAASGGIEFSFVSTRGNDVWAGGSHASLIHSRDGGLTWEIVKLGDAATGTVVNITAGALNVQVRTSDNQTWSSADGGKSWTLHNE